MSKSILLSKTFWFNVLSIALELLQIVPLPPGTVTIIVNVINILLRWLTVVPVTIPGMGTRTGGGS